MNHPETFVKINVYIHQNRRRLPEWTYAGDDRFGWSFPLRRAHIFFDDYHGDHVYWLIGFGQEGFAFAFHLEAICLAGIKARK